MCGRVSLTSTPQLIAEIFGFATAPDFPPRFNIAPSQNLAAVRLQQSERVLTSLRWGLVPSWAKDSRIGNRLINARAETVATTPAFRAAYRARRCLVVVDGFYEWQRLSAGKKQPWHIHMRGRQPFAIASLWERWAPQGGQALESCTLITTTPNELMAPIHNRMPVILPSATWSTWLDPTISPSPSLLEPYPAEEMTATSVSDYVNNPRNDGPECVTPV